MSESGKPVTPFYVQSVLLALYGVLAVGFGLKRVTWPLSAYYIGCLVKDSAVFALALSKLR